MIKKIVLVMLAFLLVGCSPQAELPLSYASPDFEQLPDTASDAGGYSARVQRDMFSSQTDHQYYNWSPFDVFLPGKDCVTVGSRTDSITLKYRYDYKWEKEGNNYCLVHR